MHTFDYKEAPKRLLTPEIVNTLIKRIDVHNPDEKELLSLMDEIRNEKSA